MNRDELETALDRGELQASSNGTQWYNIRRNGATKTWKRQPSKVEIPCKVGFRECFRLTVWLSSNDVRTDRHIRVRPANFDPRKRV